MYYNLYIKPETLNILGGVQETCSQGTRPQGDPIDEPSLWQWICSNVKKAFDCIGKALDFIKEKVLPIIGPAATLINALGNYQRSTGNVRYVVCPK